MILLVLLPVVANGACSSGHTQLTVLCAGSLIVPFQELADKFEAAYPNVDVLLEGHGSIQVIREVTELGKEADVMAVADYSLLPMMMYNNEVPGAGESYGSWCLKFATNRLGLAFTTTSTGADRITDSNWYNVLSEAGIKLGVPDPRYDSCGYRALMLCQLAEEYYSDDTIFERVMGTFSPPITVTHNADMDVISVPEVVKPTKVTVRGYSVALLGLLESGDLDYSFEYESVARQHGLGFVALPPEIDLSSRGFADGYGQVVVKMDFHRFASINPEFRGEPIQYAVTIPSNSPHPEVAVEFVEFLLGDVGQGVFLEAHQPTLVPPEADNSANMPAGLESLLGG